MLPVRVMSSATTRVGGSGVRCEMLQTLLLLDLDELDWCREEKEIEPPLHYVLLLGVGRTW
jgi:hypothetical protein